MPVFCHRNYSIKFHICKGLFGRLTKCLYIFGQAATLIDRSGKMNKKIPPRSTHGGLILISSGGHSVLLCGERLPLFGEAVLFKLEHIERVVSAALFKKLEMVALLYNFAVGEDDYVIRVLYS